MPVLYLSAVEWIKKRNFDVAVPAFYHPYLPEEMKNPKAAPLTRPHRFGMTPMRRRELTPFRQIVDESQIQSASYSVEIMLDMFQKKIEFTIINDDDIPEIFDGLDRYLLSLKADVELGLEHAVAYAKLVIRWRAEVYKHYYRYMQLNPTAKEALYPNNNPTKNLLHLMSMASGVRKEQLELDPLKARARPPYDVEGSLPKEKVLDNQEDFEMGSSLGLSSGTILSDDGKDFNFDDFLKRGN